MAVSILVCRFSVVALLVFGGCGEREAVSRISSPRELLSVGTTTLRWQPTNCEAFAGAAGLSMRPRDVVVTVWERGYDRGSDWVDFPPRPQRFGPVADAEPAGRGCGEPSGTMVHWRNFSDSGRHLHTLVRIGPDAPASTAGSGVAHPRQS